MPVKKKITAKKTVKAKSKKTTKKTTQKPVDNLDKKNLLPKNKPSKKSLKKDVEIKKPEVKQEIEQVEKNTDKFGDIRIEMPKKEEEKKSLFSKFKKKEKEIKKEVEEVITEDESNNEEEKNSKKIKNKKKKKSSLSTIYVGIGKERNYFIENMSMLVGSGLGIVPAIRAVKEEIKSKAMKGLLDQIANDVENGFPMWEAFKRSTIFGENLISLIRTGEESGRLHQNLKLIAEQEEKSRQFKSKLRGAMMYPVLVMILTVTVGMGIAIFILPRLATVFTQLQLELPKITEILIGVGSYLGENGATVIPLVFIGLLILMYFIFIFKKTKFIGQSILFGLPVIHNLVMQLEVSRFTYLLGSLLNAGIPIDQALTSLMRSASVVKYKKFYKFLLDHIKSGGTFQSAFEEYKHLNRYIPSTVQQLVIAGERSGNLSEILLKVSVSYEEKTETLTKNLSVLLEPILLIIVWLGVVAVALGVILPVYNLIGGLNQADQGSQVASPSEAAIDELLTQPDDETNVEQNIVEEAQEIKETAELITVLETGIGYLNVRAEPAASAKLLQRILPGEEYEFVIEQNGWIKIVINDEQDGWVSSQYVSKK